MRHRLAIPPLPPIPCRDTDGLSWRCAVQAGVRIIGIGPPRRAADPEIIAFDEQGRVRAGEQELRRFRKTSLYSAQCIGLLKGANFGKQLVRVGPDKL
jgi:hypothetical protein